jgi:copper chaperone
MSTKTFVVPDISCEHCEHAIIGALSPRAGVQSVAVDIPAKKVRVAFDEQRITVDEMKQVLAEEDYPVASVS